MKSEIHWENKDNNTSVIRDNIAQTGGSEERLRFAISLNTLLASKGIDQKDFALMVGTTKASISEYCTGRTDPKLTMIVRMAAALGVDCNRLLTGIDTEYKEINETTGLSQKAIETLQGISKHCESPHFSKIELVNAFLETEMQTLETAVEGLEYCFCDAIAESIAVVNGQHTVHDRKAVPVSDNPFGLDQRLVVSKQQYGNYLLSRVAESVVKKLQGLCKDKVWATAEWKASYNLTTESRIAHLQKRSYVEELRRQEALRKQKEQNNG